MSDAYKETYREEARELLEALEKAALEFAADPANGRLVNDIFRALHTIKGTSAMFGLDEVSAFAHDLESLYVNIRDGVLPGSREAAELTLEAADFLRACITAFLDGQEGDGIIKGKRQDLLEWIRRLNPAGGEAGAGPSPPAPEEPAAGRAVTYRIRFRPPEDIFLKGINPEAVLRELSALGICQILALLDKIPALEELDPERCYIAWDILLTTNRGLNAVKDVFIFVEDQSAITIDALDVREEDADRAEGAGPKKLGEILLERGDITEDDLSKALKTPQRLGDALSEARVVGRQTILSALAEQEYIKKLKQIRLTDLKLSSIRVKSEKVDDLLNLVGELVTLQERLKTTAARLDSEDLLLVLEENERVVENLRNGAMTMRLLSLDTIFSRYQRVVHDLAADLGKKAELVVFGAETELDKNIIERVNDPLVHLIRNCIDHGIEPGEERTALGKTAEGRITLKAYHAEANIHIEISDDGRGLDREAILKKAREKGLVRDDQSFSDEEVFSFVFLPGFSTAAVVSEISGRGVGMDVVKRMIESLGGRVTLKSERGAGTTVLLKIPLTLSIIDGLFVRVDGDLFVIPLSSIEECVEIIHEEGERAEAGRILSVRGEILPYVRLREFFGISGALPHYEKVVVVRADRRVGIAVDEVVGNAQVVIKSMGGMFAGVEGILGATVTGDGTVSLILDVGRITAVVQREEAARKSGEAARKSGEAARKSGAGARHD
jgi:two-component system chemotaxis sensor kinase CheA